MTLRCHLCSLCMYPLSVPCLLYITITIQAEEMPDLDKCISGELLSDDVVLRLDACLQAWKLTGDGSGGSAGSRSWISEMYGYVQAFSLSGLQANSPMPDLHSANVMHCGAGRHPSSIASSWYMEYQDLQLA